jgi:hypothetical protein
MSSVRGATAPVRGQPALAIYGVCCPACSWRVGQVGLRDPGWVFRRSE